MKCIHCNVEMETGKLISISMFAQSGFQYKFRGDKSMPFLSTKTFGDKVSVFRCQKCGRVDFYTEVETDDKS